MLVQQFSADGVLFGQAFNGRTTTSLSPSASGDSLSNEFPLSQHNFYCFKNFLVKLLEQRRDLIFMQFDVMGLIHFVFLAVMIIYNNTECSSDPWLMTFIQ